MISRPITNSGQPLTDPSGSPLVGVEVSAQLVDCDLNPCKVVDALTGDVVFGTVSSATDATGVFTLDLWPNSRGTQPSQYLCKIGALVEPFVIVVADLPGPLSIFDAMKAGGLPPC